MSNLFKSKIVLGLMIVAAVVFSTGTAEAAITKTLKYGMKDTQVKELQQNLNAAGFTVSTTGAGSTGYETTSFGSKTKTAVQAYQVCKNLTADGIFGPASRAAWNGQGCGTTTTPTNPTTPTQTGPVTAKLSTTSPASGTLVAGQATATLSKFTFSGTGVVTGVTLQRTGVSADTTPSNVYLFDGATRLTDAASVSNNGTVTFTAPAGLFTVNGLKDITVKSDIAGSTSGQTVGFNLATFTTAAGTTTANVAGNIHSIASVTNLATVALSGTVTPSGATLNPGANVTVWQGTLNVSQRDVLMKRISLRNIGSAPASAFANLKLFVNGVQVGTATGLDANGYATFDLNASPVTLASGSRVVRLDSDIISGASRTVQFSLRNAADVDFVDSSFGVNIAPTSTPWGSTTANSIGGSTGGSVTVEKDTTSPSTNVTLAGNDQTIGTFKITAYGEPVKIETLTPGFTFTDGGTVNAAATLRNGKVLLSTNGTTWIQYGSTSTLVPAGTTYTVNYTVTPGTPVWVKLNADIYDNDGTGSLDTSDTIVAKLVTGSSNAQKVDSLGSLNVPSADVTANSLSIASATATLTTNTTYANQTVAVPATAFKLGSWNLSGSSVEDVLLTTLSFDIEGASDTFEAADLTNMSVIVKNGATTVANPSPIATVSAADNNFSINYTLAKNSSVSIELWGNIGSSVTNAHVLSTDLIVSGTALTSGIAVTTSEVAGQTLTAGTATLTATTDASTPVASIVSDNQTITAAAFKFDALTSAFNVTDLTFTLANATVVSTVELYDGATLVASKPGSATVTFNGLNWNVPGNTNKVLTVKLVLGGVGIGAGTSGSAQTVTLTDFTAVNSSTGVSDASANDAGPSIENNPAGNAIYAYASIPTIANVALPTTNLTTGTVTASKFAVTSNGGTIGWKKIVFTVTRAMGGTDTLATPTLWDADTNTQIAGVGAFTGGVEADGGTSGTITFVATSEQQVSGTKNYLLKLTTAGAFIAGDNLNVSIAQPSSYVAPAAYATVAATASSFTWTDTSATSHSETTLDWSNAFLVKNLPTDTQTLQKI